MPGIIISDTSCLILLEKLGKLELLKTVFGKLTITQIVADEFEKAIPEFIEIENPKDKNYQRILESFLDSGEASAIALALEKENPLLIIDDYKARREAKQLRIKYTGTLGILIVAKEKGLIDSVTEILDDIKKTDFRISERLVNEIILKSGE
jgi:predicted nucleic acid-binding protein